MPQSIHQLNIQYYRRLLLQIVDNRAKCRQILKLLAEEEVKAEKSATDGGTTPAAWTPANGRF
jgi:hypothetical protein